MNKDRFYQLIIIALILLLGLLIGKSILKHKRPKGKRGHGPKQIVIDRLQFDDTQIKFYEDIIQEHRSSIKFLDREIQNNKSHLYSLLNENNKGDTVDSLTSVIARLHKQIEQSHFRHFHDIQAICKEDQLDLFETLTMDLAQIFTKSPQGHKK